MLKREDIFKDIYKLYFGPLCVWAKRYIDDVNVCQDIVSEVFARLWFKWDQFLLREEKIISFLKVCVRNDCFKYLRKHRGESSIEFFQEALDRSSEPDQLLTLDELYGLLMQAVEELPEDLQKIFYQSFMQERKQKDIASSMNISIRTVQRNRMKILLYLKNKFKDVIPVFAFLTILGS